MTSPVVASAVNAGHDRIGLPEQVAAFLAAARAASGDGITWVEFGELLLALLRMSVDTLDYMGSLSGAAKKELAMNAAAALFDTLASRAVPGIAYPLWIVVRPAVRALVLALADGAIEVVLPMVRSA